VRKDIVQLVKALKDRCPALELVAIPTNGFLTEKVLSTVKELLEVLGKNVLLNVNVSIDDIGERHDYIRRTPGGYQKAIRTLDELMKVQLAEDSFETGTETVVMDHNIKDIRHIYSTLKEHTAHVNLTPAILSPFYNPEDTECGKLSPETVDQLVEFLEELTLKEPAYAYYNSKACTILQAKKLKKRPFPCLGGFKTLYLDAKGNVYPCLMLPVPKFCFGNIREAPMEELWYGPAADDIRRRLKGHLFCTRCTNNCDIMNNIKEETLDLGIWMLKNPKVRKALYKDLEEGKMKKYL
jgi:radical SAM protein with 4Fe4S-binding SPASM domain